VQGQADLARPAVGVAGLAAIPEARAQLGECRGVQLGVAEAPVAGEAAAAHPRRDDHLLGAGLGHRPELLGDPELGGAARHVDRDRTRLPREAQALQEEAVDELHRLD